MDPMRMAASLARRVGVRVATPVRDCWAVFFYPPPLDWRASRCALDTWRIVYDVGGSEGVVIRKC